MTEFEKILQECLLDLDRSDSSVDECLSRYPGHAPALEPVLLTSLELERGREARPSAAFKARVRARLVQEMQAHPRRSIRFQFLFTRLATGFAVILLAFLAAGTVYAQGALPGQFFYQWKLTSEKVWRAISPDPVGADLAIADRRANELIAVGDNRVLHTQILNAYLEAVSRLELEMNPENEARIRTVLDSQMEALNQSGISIPPLEPNILPSLEEPTAIPEIPKVNPTLPVPAAASTPVQEPAQSNPTDSPEIIPSLPVETEIIPTVQAPSLIP